jgi:hypothetical protein
VPSVNRYARSRMCVLVSRSTGNRLCFTARRKNGLASACNSQNTKLPGLRFRAWLTEEGTRQIELARA